jgi:hypothetical protein
MQGRGGVVFQVVDKRTGELLNALDCCSRDELDRKFRIPGMKGYLLCPSCRAVVVLHRNFDETPHFFHPDESICPQADIEAELLTLRAALFRHLRREFGFGVEIEHVIQHPDVPRAVDCRVEDKGKVFMYWIVTKEMKLKNKHVALCQQIEKEGGECRFVFSEKMLRCQGEKKSVVRLTDTEIFAKMRTPFDILNGKNEGGSLHYLQVTDDAVLLITYRSLLAVGKTKSFSGIRKETALHDTEVCGISGGFVHPEEKRYSEILRTRKLREELAHEPKPEDPVAVKWAKWRKSIEHLPRSNEPISVIVARMLKPRDDLPTIRLRREREAPCEYCGVVTDDWIVFDGKTGLCKCRNCYEDRARKRYEREGDNDSESGKGGTNADS